MDPVSTVQGRTHRAGLEAHWTHRSGKPPDVMVFESPLVDGRGRQVGWMGSIVDVTAASVSKNWSVANAKCWHTMHGYPRWANGLDFGA